MSKKYIIFIGIIMLFIGILGISTLFTRKAPVENPPLLSPTPIPNSGGSNATNLQNSIQKADAEFVNNMKNPLPLSSSDANAKTALINSLGADQETVYTTSDFIVTYISPYDLFQVEITNSNIQQTENEAINWFASKGISKDGVCNMPVMFYPSFDVRQQLQTQNSDMPLSAYVCSH